MQEQQQAEFDRENKAVLTWNDLPVSCKMDPSFWNLCLNLSTSTLSFSLYEYSCSIWLFYLGLWEMR